MQITNTNCKKIISLFTLTLYVCFLTIAVFHIHTYDFKSIVIVSDINGDSDNKIKDPFLDDQSDCKLVQFLHTYYSTSSTPYHDLSVLPILEDVRIYSSIECYDSPKIYRHFLRAPPLVEYSA